MGGGKHPLAFLGKKQFHTKNLKVIIIVIVFLSVSSYLCNPKLIFYFFLFCIAQNVEAVWIAEEKEKAEQKKLQDLQKQIIEERQMEDLRTLQAEAGIGKKRTEKLDWMYEGPMSGVVDAQESEEYLLGKAFEPKAVTEEVNKQISKHSEQPGALWSVKPSANDAFTRMHEDPMMKIRQQELRARESVIKNPLKMNKVKKEIEAQLRMEKEAKKEHKRMKKEKKAEKKRLKKEKKEKKEKKHKRSRSRSNSSSDSSDNDEEGEERKSHDKHDNSRGEGDGGGSGRGSEKNFVRDPRFGLQNASISRTYAADELGPSAELRNQKKLEASNQNNYNNSSKRPREKLSEEEKAKRLREMQLDAEQHDERRNEIMVHNKAAKELDEKAKVSGEKDASFLKEMGDMVYLSGNIDMEERIKRNRQNHQKDLGSDSFMRK
jgi:hypothetical protein